MASMYAECDETLEAWGRDGRNTLARQAAGPDTTWNRNEYPTPSSTRYGTSQNEGAVEHDRPSRGTPSLDSWAATWPTPCANPEAPNKNSNTVNGPTSLGEAAVAWAPPTTDRATYAYSHGKNVPTLLGQAEMWATPRSTDGEKGGPNGRDGSGSPHLCSQAVTRERERESCWQTPRVSSANGWSEMEVDEMNPKGRLETQAEIFARGLPDPKTPTDGDGT